MNNFRVILTEHAISDLKGISKVIKDQIHRDIKALQSSPFPSGTHIKKLKGFRPQKHLFKIKKTAIFLVFLQKIKNLARPDPQNEQ